MGWLLGVLKDLIADEAMATDAEAPAAHGCSGGDCLEPTAGSDWAEKPSVCLTGSPIDCVNLCVDSWSALLEDIATAEAIAIDAEAGAAPAAHGCSDSDCKEPGADDVDATEFAIIPGCEGTGAEAATFATNPWGVIGERLLHSMAEAPGKTVGNAAIEPTAGIAWPGASR